MRGVRGETERLWKLWKDLSRTSVARQLLGLSYLGARTVERLGRLAYLARGPLSTEKRSRSTARGPYGRRVVR